MPPKRILVADDDEDQRMILELLLRTEGHHVLLATDGLQALEQVRQHRPDLVTLDLCMPRATGWEVMRRIREDPRVSRVPVLGITGFSAHELDRDPLQAGFTAVVGKPCDLGELLAMVRQLLASGP